MDIFINLCYIDTNKSVFSSKNQKTSQKSGFFKHTFILKVE